MLSENSYLLSQVSPSLRPSVASSVVDLNGVEILLHRPAMFSGHYLSSNTAPVIESAALLSQDVGSLIGDPFSMANTSQIKKPTVKRDRHSKIFTAEGPRDRRVRLSMDIARKFFDLQEMLGFDKPSKTLDWLLTKSRSAIKELVQTKQNGRSSSLSECEALSSAGNTEVFENGNYIGADSGRKFANKYKGATDPQQQPASNLAKESRAKARARARERTREKMCIKQLNEARNMGSDLNPAIPIQDLNNQLERYQLSAGSNGTNTSCAFKANAGVGESILHWPPSNEAAAEDLIRESIMIKRESNLPPSSFGFHQNLIVSRDLSSTSNYSIPSDNATENWGVCSFTSQFNMCAIWDQHKFIDSASII